VQDTGSGFCYIPAYTLLLPAHGALWLAGRWYATHQRQAWSTLLPLAGALLGAAVVAEVLASGGFYLFSGRFTELSLAELASGLVRYFPTPLEALVLSVGLPAMVHAALALARGEPRRRDLTACRGHGGRPGRRARTRVDLFASPPTHPPETTASPPIASTPASGLRTARPPRWMTCV